MSAKIQRFVSWLHDHTLVKLIVQLWHDSKLHISRKNALLGAVAAVVFLMVAYGMAFYQPSSHAFSFSRKNCFAQPVVLPNFISKKSSPTFTVQPQVSLSVRGYPLYSGTTCVTAAQAPKENTEELIPFGSGLFQKKIKVSTKSYPSLTATNTLLRAPVSTGDPFTLQLDTPDNVFTYHLRVDQAEVTCGKHVESVRCDVTSLNLVQSKQYTFTLIRLFGTKPVGTLFSHPMRTVENVRIVGSGIKKDRIVYGIPRQFTLTLSREAVTIQGAKLVQLKDNKQLSIPIKASVQGKQVTIQFRKPLPRDAAFLFSVRRVVAADGGFIPKAFSLPFKTSGGPRVLGVNIGNYKAPRSGSIVVTFDTPLSKNQNARDFVSLAAGDKTMTIRVQASSNSIVITPATTLPRCTLLTLTVNGGLTNSYGVGGGAAWSYRSRTICHTVFSIGSSVSGRAITAYKFGSGPSLVVFVGTTHGNETSSTRLLMQWIDDLEARGSLPARRTVVVIPNLNPDGYATGRRTNARNVDLNRNFPANNWKSSVIMPDGSRNTTGGGTRPLSEPESAALARYVTNTRPRMVLTYHAVAGVVIPNGSGDSIALARAYAHRSNVGYASNGETDSIFNYDTTGAFEDWLHDKLGLPTMLVELWTMGGHEFASHQNAMRSMANLP